ncbi:hypothetical protein AKJ65_00540 [candidate division MSBL1 archaeon SCGC-AAA259E19]|uniref:Uncharacterized protein n=1 Tax=candidate division MSBL1 archaeon SCGC-AAA259E19 TaxID=1698264 RepID=A0A133UNM0_9EURY|nr:hypothetical protein AKJ65_00540 [candidate division MSBL1 archaeon SCGC-AAA259E19]
MARDAWQKGEEEKAFGYVYPAIRDYSERNGFYEAWRFLREEPKGSVLTDMKDFKLFKPLDEAFFRRIEFEEKDVLITSVYRHLWRGIPVEKVLEMMREGKYDSPPPDTKTEVSSEFGSLPL